jgi:hypothetical protein
MPGDLFHLPDNADHQQVFGYAGEIQTWTKPLGITMVHMVALSSGAGGGGGYSAGGATQAGGGGGGGTGGISSVIVPASFLPDVLYVYAAPGGAGGSAGNAGGNGAASWAGMMTVSTAQSLYLISSLPSSLPIGGGAGTSSAGGTGGASGAAPTSTNMPLSVFGMIATVIGVAGASGGASTGPTTANPGAVPLFPASGGAGTTGSVNGAGGGTLSGSLPWYSYAQPGGAAGGGHGQDGTALRIPPYFMGGFGGGSNYAGTGGSGGNGATGCAGGGGGGGTTGGAGGAGGNGAVWITCWLQRVIYSSRYVTYGLLAAPGLPCNITLAMPLRQQLPDLLIARCSGCEQAFATLSPRGCPAACAHRLPLASPAVFNTFVPVRILLGVLMTIPARWCISALPERPTLIQHVLTIRLTRVPSKVLQAIVLWIGIGMVTALHAGRARLVKGLQDQAMNELAHLTAVFG